MKSRYLSMFVLAASGFIACHGDSETDDLRYGDLVDDSGVGETSTQSLTVRVAVIGTSKHHVGELDVLGVALDKVKGEGTALVTLESPSGLTFGSMPLPVGELRDPLRQAPVDSTAVLEASYSLSVPSQLVAQGSFRANLFVCVDTDGDASCSDEIVDPHLGNENVGEAQVVAFVPLVAQIEGGEVRMRRLRPGDEGYGVAEEVLEKTLANYDPSGLALTPWESDATEAAVVLSAFTTAEGEGSGAKGSDDDPGGEPGGADDGGGEDPGGEEEPECNLADCANLLELDDQQGYIDCVQECGTERTSGCFELGTRIATGPDSWIPVERLVPGSEVMTADGRVLPVEQVVAGPEYETLVRVEIDGTTLGVTKDHPMVTADGIKKAAELTLRDELVTRDRGLSPVRSLASSVTTWPVFNVTLEGKGPADHLVVAEGIVTGDLSVQNEIAADRVAANAPLD